MYDNNLAPETLLRQLHWRYATKKFDPTRKIPRPQWEALEQSLVLSPSSYGLQPWKFLVIDNPEIRAKLLGLSYGQTKVVEASHYVVFAHRKDYSGADVDRYIARIAEVRGATPESLEGYRQLLLGSTKSATEKGYINTWMSRQVYIALGTLLTSAALLGIDAGPMEGIETAKYDELLELAEQGYGSLCAAALGYRAADDEYAALPKVRFPLDQIIQHI
jgi:nitroreductase